MEALQQYLHRLSPRDRVAVIVLTIFVAVSLLSLGALNLHRSAEKAQQQAQQEKELLAWLQASAPLLSGSGSNNLTLYINGSSAGTATNTTSFTGVTANGFAVCAEYAGSFGAGKAAYFDDVRITKGYARSSTTPTAAFGTQ